MGVKVISGTCSSGMPVKKQPFSQSLPRLGGGALPRSPDSSWPEAQSVLKSKIPSPGRERYRGQYLRISLRVANTIVWNCSSTERFNLNTCEPFLIVKVLTVEMHIRERTYGIIFDLRRSKQLVHSHYVDLFGLILGPGG